MGLAVDRAANCVFWAIFFFPQGRAGFAAYFLLIWLLVAYEAYLARSRLALTAWLDTGIGNAASTLAQRLLWIVALTALCTGSATVGVQVACGGRGAFAVAVVAATPVDADLLGFVAFPEVGRLGAVRVGRAGRFRG